LTEQDLSDDKFTYQTATFRALGHVFAVRTNDPQVGRLFDELYAACAVEGAPESWYSVLADGPDPGGRSLYFDDEYIAYVEKPNWLLGYVAWRINHEVIARSSGYVLVHAAAASLRDIGIVIPGAPEAGKTTLVAGLVRAGFSYLTDEATAIVPSTLRIEPYPKPLSIDPGSWSVLADLQPSPGDAGGYFDHQWSVPPTSIRTDAVGSAVPPRLFVFPQYRPNAPTSCSPMPRSEILVELLRQTFGVHDHGRHSLEVLAAAVRESRGYRMTVGDLNEAVEAVRGLIEAPEGGEADAAGR